MSGAAVDLLRIVVHGDVDGALNMAVDDVLLDGLAPGYPYTLRLYGWKVPTVSLGYAQRWREGFDTTAPGASACSLVRRRTGGRAVMHAHELTYAIAGPAMTGPFEGGVQSTYRRIAAGLLQGLSRLGLTVQLERSSGRRPPGEPGACFASRARHELVADGRKLIGSAQRRTQRRVLQHGSLPLPTPDPRSVGLHDLLRPPPGRRRLVAALAGGVAAELGMQTRYAGLSRAEARAATRRAALYRDSGYTCRV